MRGAVEPQLRAAIALNEVHGARLKRLLLLSWGRHLAWWAPLTLGALFFLADDWVFVFALLTLVLLPTLTPNAAQRGLARSLALLTDLTADLGHALTQDDEAQWALWAELSARMAALHGPAFTAPPLTDEQRRRGAKLAATQRLQRALDEAPALGGRRLWEPWVRPAVAAMASCVACVAVVVAGMSPGVYVSALATVALVIALGAVIGAVFFHPSWSFTRRRQHAERSRFMASDIRAFLEDDGEDGELCLDRWLKLRAEHDDWFFR